MKICSECGLENIDEAVYCRNCGNELENEKSINNEIRPIDDVKIIVNENPSILKKYFLKKINIQMI